MWQPWKVIRKESLYKHVITPLMPILHKTANVCVSFWFFCFPCCRGWCLCSMFAIASLVSGAWDALLWPTFKCQGSAVYNVFSVVHSWGISLASTRMGWTLMLSGHGYRQSECIKDPSMCGNFSLTAKERKREQASTKFTFLITTSSVRQQIPYLFASKFSISVLITRSTTVMWH